MGQFSDSDDEEEMGEDEDVGVKASKITLSDRKLPPSSLFPPLPLPIPRPWPFLKYELLCLRVNLPLHGFRNASNNYAVN